MTPVTPNIELKAVGSRIGEAIQLFYDNRMAANMPHFRAEHLRVFVETVVGKSAPGSADRILRDMRQAGKLNYKIINRSKSEYMFLPVVGTKGVEFACTSCDAPVVGQPGDSCICAATQGEVVQETAVAA